ncbi:MAG: ATP-binding protein [Pseudomonadota bacterium]
MNPQSDFNRFMALMKAFYVLVFLLFGSVIFLYLFPISSHNRIIQLFVIAFLSGLIIISIILFLLIKHIKKIDLGKQDVEKALLTSEKKYKSIVENIQIGFARSTPGEQGQYIEVNSYFAQMLGYSKAELIKMPVADLYEDKNKRKEFSDKISEMDFVKNEEVVFRKKNGDVITISVTGQTIRDENSKIIFFDLILEDITDKKFHLNESIKSEKLSSIGILAGGIAHDFNNILTGLYGNIALAKLELDSDSEAALLILDAEQSMLKATDLTQQLLIFAKGGDPIKETISIGQTIKDTAKFNLSGSNIKLETHFDEQLWPVNADKGQINQVISNLVINARHAMPDGGHLTITGTNIELKNNEIASLVKGNYVKIIVQDDGIGIPNECLSRIFDPYYTTKHAGSGMGLATSFSIIKKHQGWITATSNPGKGAVFHIFLPADTTKEDIMLLERDVGDSNVASANILIMDDDDQVCIIAQKMITRFGYQSFIVHDGKQAIEAYQQAINNAVAYDLVLMDLTIPGGMGGKDAILKILDIDPDAKAVVISGYSNDPVLANYQDYGFKGMLVKPFKISELKEVLEKALR